MSKQAKIKLRREGHAAFDRIWINGVMGRAEAYRMLADWLGLPIEECHFSRFRAAQCRKAIEFCLSIDARSVKKHVTGRKKRNARKRQILSARLEEMEVSS